MNFGERLSALTSRQKAVAGLAALVVVAGGTVGGVVATSSSPKHKAAPSSSSTPPPSTPKPTPTPKAKPKPKPKPKPQPPAVNPLAGRGPVPAGPVIAVKIDDTASGRPQRGINQANIVYIEQAEGGLTRLIGVFASRKPVVEAVRSVRTSDPELLLQYGRITLVASGGGGDAPATLFRSGLHAVVNDRGGPGFGRDGSRPIPYNLTSNLEAVSRAIRVGRAKSIGFTWANTPAGVHTSNRGTAVHTLVGGTPVDFRWDANAKQYIRLIGGTAQRAADGHRIATPNVIVQFCKVTVHTGDIDTAGNPAQYTHSIGAGRVVVFRNGKRIDGTWSRSSVTHGTILRDAHGRQIPLAPGGAYVVLATRGGPLSSS